MKNKTGIEYYYLKSKTSKKPVKVFVKVPVEKLFQAGPIFKVRSGWLEFERGAMNLFPHNIASKKYPLKVFINGKVVDKYTTWNSVKIERRDWEREEQIFKRPTEIKHRKRFGVNKLILD